MKNKGFSMITIVITVVVIIILTSIVMQTSSDVPDKANYTKYVNVVKGVQSAIEDAKLKNSRKGSTEEKLTAGFDRVYLENAPENFASFGTVYEDTRGYLVDLQKIDYLEAEYGQGYSNFNSGDKLKFGDKNCDVFVFDADWTVYYVKGLKYNGSMNYNVDE
jgi:type II secretory pathway pseudopilin PulG